MGGEPPCTPPTLTTSYWGDTGAAVPEEKEARFWAATCPAGCSPSFVFLFSKAGEVAGGVFPQKEKAPGLLIPQSSGSSGPEASGSSSTVLPREIWEWTQRGPGHVSALSPFEKRKPTLLFQSRLWSEGQHPAPGQEPFSEEVSVLAPHTPEVGLGLVC